MQAVSRRRHQARNLIHAIIFLVPLFKKQSVSIVNGHRLESRKPTYKNKDATHRAMAFQPTMEVQSIFIVQ